MSDAHDSRVPMATEENWPWYLIAILIIFVVLIIITIVVVVWCCCRCWTEDRTWWTTMRRKKRRYVNMTSADPVYAAASLPPARRQTDGMRLKTAINDNINITLKAGEDGKIPPLRALTVDGKHRKRKWKSNFQDKVQKIPRYFKGRSSLYHNHQNGDRIRHVHGDDTKSFRSLPPGRKHNASSGFRSLRGDPSMRKAMSWHDSNSDYTLVRVRNALGDTSEARPDSYFRQSTGPSSLDNYRPVTLSGQSSIIGPVYTSADARLSAHHHQHANNGFISSRMDPADNIFRTIDPPAAVTPPPGTFSHTIALDPGPQQQVHAMMEPTYASVAPRVVKHERAHVYHAGDGTMEAPIIPQQVQLLYEDNVSNNNNNVPGTYYVTTPSVRM